MGSMSQSCPARDRAQCEPDVAGFFERRTCAIQYVVSEPETGACAIIDPVLDYDERSGSIATASADALLRYVSEQNLRVAGSSTPTPTPIICRRLHTCARKQARRLGLAIR
jgi:hypothetical protein